MIQSHLQTNVLRRPVQGPVASRVGIGVTRSPALALLLLLWAASAFINADPKQVALLLRWIGGGTALLLAGSTSALGQKRT